MNHTIWYSLYPLWRILNGFCSFVSAEKFTRWAHFRIWLCFFRPGRCSLQMYKKCLIWDKKTVFFNLLIMHLVSHQHPRNVGITVVSQRYMVLINIARNGWPYIMANKDSYAFLWTLESWNNHMTSMHYSNHMKMVYSLKNIQLEPPRTYRWHQQNFLQLHQRHWM